MDDRERMARVVEAIAHNEVIIAKLEEMIRSSVKVEPLLVDASTCTAEDFASTVLESEAGLFLCRPHIAVQKLRMTLAEEKRLQETERAAYVQTIARLQQSALALRGVLPPS